MIFLYATDLHGDKIKYERLFDHCVKYNIKTLHLGADLLPKGSGIQKEQKKFVKGFLKEYHQQCSSQGIQILSFFGNDDLWTRKPTFREYAKLLDETPVEIDGFRFSAYPYVPDYPFGLKTACKYDYDGWVPEPYISSPVEIGEAGFEPIADVQEYFRKKGTIKEDLDGIHVGSQDIIAIHTPPYGVGLDVCVGGRTVGSKAVYQWIEREQPYMVLCGHIHESPKVSKISRTSIGKTMVIQPGQEIMSTSAAMIEAIFGEMPIVTMLDL